MTLLDTFAPRHSRRRMLLKMARDFIYRPASIRGRLSSVNFHNARVAHALRIHCPACGNDAGVFYDYPDLLLRRAHGIGILRETLNCRSCGASMRDRQVALGLLKVFAERTGRELPDLAAWRRGEAPGLRILDTDSFSSISKVLRGMPGYIHSQYKPLLPNGERLIDGSINVNLLDMPFDEGGFDVILSSDVMEHVPDDERAHREILRCLANSGVYIFTVPYDPTLRVTRRLAFPAGGQTGTFLIERHIHGDPHAASGILAYRIYGADFLDELRSIGYQPQFLEINSSTAGIFGGDLFLARRET